MKNRFTAALLALFLLITALPVSGQAEQERFSNVDDLKNWLYYDCTYMLADEIEFYYTEELDAFFEDGVPSDMLHGCGMVDWDASVGRNIRRVRIRNIDYFPGFKAAQAWEIEVTHILDEDERTLLAHAEDMVEDARRYAQSPYQVLINLHDALIKRVVYTHGDNEEWNYLDTAIGALVYGQAECDGYADAFCLLATLAGFQIRMIAGDAAKEDGVYSPHMWNLLWWEDGWYHVDTTWDDPDWAENDSMTLYRYFLQGSSMIPDHRWEEDQPICEPAQYTNWNACYYTTDNTGVTYGAYYKTMEDMANYVVYMKKNYNRNMMHIMVDGKYEDEEDAWQTVSDALKRSGLSSGRAIWARTIGSYTYVAIYVY